ncbi:hypothetical protein DFS34DRAFT_647815 [Phlyctochytrium arcticum]|nr:hypothetical protein DFS34DRAFT_647815 [Phlyctochytrium arcticum]
MSNSTDRKRQLEEVDGKEDSISKKHRSGLIEGPEVDESDLDGDIPGSRVLEYQKKAIWRRMQYYKQIAEDAKSRVARSEKQQRKLHTELLAAKTCCEKTFVTLHVFHKQHTSRPDSAPNDLNGTPPSIDLDRFEQSLSVHEASMVTILNSLQDKLSGGTTESTSESLVAKVQADCRSLIDEVAKLRSDCDSHRLRTHELTSELEITKQSLARVRSQLDRRLLDTASNPPEPAGLPDTAVNSQINEPAEEDTIHSDNVGLLRQVEQLRAEKEKLAHEMNSIKLKVANGQITDERVRDSPLYKNLDEEYRYCMKENELIKTRLETMSKQVEQLEGSRRQFAEQIELEEGTRRKNLESELRKVENDLQRVRNNRDTLQQTLDMRCSKDEVELQQLQEIRVIANARKDRITCLEADLCRLKALIAAKSGDRALMEYFEQNPEGDPFSLLKAKLSKALDRLKELGEEFKMDDIQLNLGSSTSSDKCSHGTGDEPDPTVDTLLLRLEFQEKSEARLLAEIESLGRAWAELEEQNSRKVLDLAQKEDFILRLIAEKTKFDQKCALLSKQATSYNNLGIAMKRQTDKQLENIRLLEQREKLLAQQLGTREKELAVHENVLQQHKRRVGDLVKDVEQSKENLKKWSMKYDNATTLLQQKTTLLETAVAEKNAFEARLEYLEKQLEKSRGDPSTESNSKQLEEYKLLLKCSSCNDNFKSHVLSKCMHTFCKSCIEHMWNSRQRKCPTCGIAFAHQDIRQVYL